MIPRESVSIAILCLLRIVATQIEDGNCRVEECTQWFARTKAYEVLVENSNPRYCQVLQTYLKCLSETVRFCHGNLKFHSMDYMMRKQWKDQRCHSFQLGHQHHASTCHFVPAAPQRSVRYCSLFGDPHLRRFDGSFQTCSEHGARPLVDNRYFLIQVTNSPIRGEALTTAVSKVTVLLRAHNCTRQLIYQTSSDDSFLTAAFDDGTTQVAADGHKKAIEVLRPSVDYVELSLRYVDASIHIRRSGPYLSVAVRAPEYVLKTGTSSSAQLCWSGCPTSSVPVEAALTAPVPFARCHQRTIHVPKRIAEDRCRLVNVTDAFFDACVFDLMFTGDEYLVAMSRDAQSDFQRVFPAHYHYVQGRQQILPYSNISSIRLENCLPRSRSSQSIGPIIGLMFHVVIFFFIT